jgi:hypothetical protein
LLKELTDHLVVHKTNQEKRKRIDVRRPKMAVNLIRGGWNFEDIEITDDRGNTTTKEQVRRGVHHKSYGSPYLGGSALNDDYTLKGAGRNYHWPNQLRSQKSTANLFRTLMDKRDNPSYKKFSGSLETTLSTTSDLDKDEFVRKIKTNIGWMGMESFFAIAKPDGSVVPLADSYFVFKVEDVLQEFTSRLVEPGPMLMGPENAETSRSVARRFKCFDNYELDAIGMSRLMVESLLTQSFLQKIETRFSHIEDYELVSGVCLFMMALDACNANESVDIEGAKTAFAALDINAYEGQNVSEFITEAMRLIKIMAGDYALDTHLGSKLLTKLSATDQVYFNRMMFNLLDEVKPFERSYKHKNPKLKEMDPRFKTLGPLALCGKIHETYAHLVADKDWTPLQSRPEVNLGGVLACFHCGGPHLKRDCPTLG